MAGEHGSELQMWQLKQKQSAHIWNWMQEAGSALKMAKVFWNLSALPQWHASSSKATSSKTLQMATNWKPNVQVPGLWGTSHLNHHTSHNTETNEPPYRGPYVGSRVNFLPHHSSRPHRPSEHLYDGRGPKEKEKRKNNNKLETKAWPPSMWHTPTILYYTLLTH